MFHLSLIGESAQSDAVLAGAGSDELLGYHSHGWEAGGQAGHQRRSCPSSSSS